MAMVGHFAGTAQQVPPRSDAEQATLSGTFPLQRPPAGHLRPAKPPQVFPPTHAPLADTAMPRVEATLAFQ
jgi:hypothetical protein